MTNLRARVERLERRAPPHWTGIWLFMIRPDEMTAEERAEFEAMLAAMVRKPDPLVEKIAELDARAAAPPSPDVVTDSRPYPYGD